MVIKMSFSVISTARIIDPNRFADRMIAALDMRFVPENERASAMSYCTGISPAAAAAWLAGDVLPAYKNMLRFCRFFRVNPAWLLTGDGIPLADDDFFMIHAAWEHADERERAILLGIARTILSRFPPPPPHPLPHLIHSSALQKFTDI